LKLALHSEIRPSTLGAFAASAECSFAESLLVPDFYTLIAPVIQWAALRDLFSGQGSVTEDRPESLYIGHKPGSPTSPQPVQKVKEDKRSANAPS